MKINKWRKYRRLVYLALTYVLLALLISFWLVNKKIETSFNPSWQPTEVQQAKAYLLEKVGYKNFRKLSRIALAESGFRQFQEDGGVLRGTINSKDIGIFQISETYWLEKSLKLGYDIYTTRGNTDMAIWIFNNYGTQPLFWSKHIWG